MFVFVGAPMYMLNYMVIPQLEAMKYNYSHFDQTAQEIASAKK